MVSGGVFRAAPIFANLTLMKAPNCSGSRLALSGAPPLEQKVSNAEALSTGVRQADTPGLWNFADMPAAPFDNIINRVIGSDPT